MNPGDLNVVVSHNRNLTNLLCIPGKFNIVK